MFHPTDRLLVQARLDERLREAEAARLARDAGLARTADLARAARLARDAGLAQTAPRPDADRQVPADLLRRVGPGAASDRAGHGPRRSVRRTVGRQLMRAGARIAGDPWPARPI